MLKNEKLQISKKNLLPKKLRGDDGHKVFSVRVKNETVAELDKIALKTDRSRNELINIFLNYCVENCEII